MAPKRKDKIEFVSYDGKWPCLCSGKLTLKVNGRTMTFSPLKRSAKAQYYGFWESSGSVNFSRDWEDYEVVKGPWVFDGGYPGLPEVIKRNKDLVMEIFNDNVQQGCCGGCS